MADLNPDLAARLRASSEQRIAEAVAAAKQQSVSEKRIRAVFAEARDAGLRNRHAAKAARLRLAEHHQQKGKEQ